MATYRLSMNTNNRIGRHLKNLVVSGPLLPVSRCVKHWQLFSHCFNAWCCDSAVLAIVHPPACLPNMMVDHSESQPIEDKLSLKGACLGHITHFWPTILLVAPLVHCVVCLSVCHLSSVTFCILAKRYVLAKNCLKEWIGNQGKKVDFLGRRHISTSGFTSTATEMAVFALFLPVQPSNRY